MSLGFLWIDQPIVNNDVIACRDQPRLFHSREKLDRVNWAPNLSKPRSQTLLPVNQLQNGGKVKLFTFLITEFKLSSKEKPLRIIYKLIWAVI